MPKTTEGLTYEIVEKNDRKEIEVPVLQAKTLSMSMEDLKEMTYKLWVEIKTVEPEAATQPYP